MNIGSQILSKSQTTFAVVVLTMCLVSSLAAAVPAGPITEEQIIENIEIQKCVACVYQKGKFGFDPVEGAAFITRTQAGLGCFYWPYTNQQKSQGYNGPIPAGTIGIIHSHPRTGGESPSPQDRIAAEQIRGFNFVVHPNGIRVFNPRAKTEKQVADRGFVQLATKKYGDSCPKN